MNISLQSTESSQPKHSAPAVARRSEPSVAEIYGGDNLPVLIRLPHLASLAADPPPPPFEGESDPGPVSPGPGDRVPLVEPQGQDRPAEQTSEPLRQQRRTRTVRRPAARAEASGWLRGIGQLAMAAVLAGILLVIVVTIKQWNVDNAKSQSAVSVPFADVPDLEFDGPMLEPISHIRPDQGPELSAPAVGTQNGSLRSDRSANISPPSLSDAVRPAAENGADRPWPDRVDARDTLRSTSTAGPSAGAYPSTGVDEPVSTGPARDAGWSETISVGPVHNATLPPSEAHGVRR